MESELILNDLIQVERKLARLEDELQRGGHGRDKAQVTREIDLFTRLAETLTTRATLAARNLQP
jgi:ribosome-binding ATPase YchF (GTP1/OBG family)